MPSIAGKNNAGRRIINQVDGMESWNTPFVGYSFEKRGWLTTIGTGSSLSGRYGNGGAHFSLRISGQVEAIGIVNNAIQKCVCMRRVGESLEPLVHRDLGSDERRAAPEAVIENFEQIARLGSRDGITHPVIQDEQIELCQAGEQIGERAIQVRLGQLE